jgi:hypothetical protein
MFVAGMYAAAYFETDPRKVVQAGLACLPPRSPCAPVASDVLEWSRRYPEDWRTVWRFIAKKWDQRDPCPAGALQAFNTDAKLNGAYIALGLLYGDGDFGRTLDVSSRCGQDAGCNPSNACGVLGAMLGYKRIDKKWKSGIPSIAGRNFIHTDFSFRTIVESTVDRVLALVRKNGGRVDGNTLFLKPQSPKAPRLEVWDDYGSPVERIDSADERWHWRGAWRPGHGGKVAHQQGAEAFIRFQGTGAIVGGPYLPTGGKADVYLDGRLERSVDVHTDEVQIRGNEAVWRLFGLKNAPHEIRVVVRGEPYKDSKGSDVGITRLIVFRHGRAPDRTPAPGKP